MATYQERRAARLEQQQQRTRSFRTLGERRRRSILRRERFRRSKPKITSTTQPKTITIKETMAEAIARLRKEGKIGSQDVVKSLGDKIFIQKEKKTVVAEPTSQGYKFLPKKKLATRRLSKKLKSFEDFLSKSTRRHITGLKGKGRSTEEKVLIGVSSGIVKGITGITRLGLDTLTGAQYLLRSKKARDAAALASVKAAKATGRFTKKAYLAELRLKKAIGQNPKGVAEATYKIIKEAARKGEISVNKWIRTTSKDEKIRQISTIGGELFGTGAAIKGARAIGGIRKTRKVIKIPPKVTRIPISQKPIIDSIKVGKRTYRGSIDLGKAGKLKTASIKLKSGAVYTKSGGRLKLGKVRDPILNKKGRVIGYGKAKPITTSLKGTSVTIRAGDDTLAILTDVKSKTNKALAQLSKSTIKKAQKQSAGLIKAAAKSKKAAQKLKAKPSSKQKFFRSRRKGRKTTLAVGKLIDEEVITRKIKGLDLIPRVRKGKKVTLSAIKKYYGVNTLQAKALRNFYRAKKISPQVFKKAQKGRTGILTKEVVIKTKRGRTPKPRIRLGIATKSRRGIKGRLVRSGIQVSKGKFESSLQTIYNLKPSQAKALKGLEKFIGDKINTKTLKQLIADANFRAYGKPLTLSNVRAGIKRKKKFEAKILKDLRKAKSKAQKVKVAQQYKKRGIIVPKKVKSYANRKLIIDARTGNARVVMKTKQKVRKKIKRVVREKPIVKAQREATLQQIANVSVEEANAIVRAAINQGTVSFTQTGFKLGRASAIPLPISYINTASARTSPQTITRIKNIIKEKIGSKSKIVPITKIKVGVKSRIKSAQQLKIGQKSKTKIKQQFIQLQEQKAAQIQLNKPASTEAQLIKTIQQLKLKVPTKIKLIQIVTEKLTNQIITEQNFFWVYFGGYAFRIYVPKSIKKKKKKGRKISKGRRRKVSTRYTPSLAEALYKRKARKKPTVIGLGVRPIIARRKRRKKIRRRRSKR